MTNSYGETEDAVVAPGPGHLPPPGQAGPAEEVEVVLMGSPDGLLPALASHLQTREVRLQAVQVRRSPEDPEGSLDVLVRLALPRGVGVDETVAGLVEAVAEELFDIALVPVGEELGSLPGAPVVDAAEDAGCASLVLGDEAGLSFPEVVALLRRQVRAAGRRVPLVRGRQGGAELRIDLDAPAFGGPAVATPAPSTGVGAPTSGAQGCPATTDGS